jgi:ParB-like chromosome segregation protein Spo0J
MDKLQIEYVSIDSIKEHEGNAKEHPELQVEQIKASMQEFGNIDPIGIWHGEIVEGHGRYMAAKELGYAEVPVIRLDGLTDEQRRAYGLIHNQLTMNSGFDAEALEAELAAISDIDMSVYAFDMDEEVTQTIRGSEEVSLEGFDDDKFSCTCPQCGFKFNPKG